MGSGHVYLEVYKYKDQPEFLFYLLFFFFFVLLWWPVLFSNEHIDDEGDDHYVFDIQVIKFERTKTKYDMEGWKQDVNTILNVAWV